MEACDRPLAVPGQGDAIEAFDRVPLESFLPPGFLAFPEKAYI